MCKVSIRLTLALALAVALTAWAAAAQPPMPKPGAEHAHLKEMVGTWDATVEGEGMPPSKGVAVWKQGPGDFWITSDFKSDMAGMPFTGHGITGYDQGKKKYVDIWVDSMGSYPMVFEGTYDESGKTITEHCEAPGMDGKPAKWTSTSTMKDKDTIVFKLYMAEKAQGKPMMTITYKRKK